jgi:hypothetical protein
MIGKKINQLATELAPVSTDLTIIGDPISGVSKKITLAQLGAIFSGAVSFYTNLAGFPAVGDINVIYCAKDTQKLYLWSGSAYVEVFPSQALLDTYQLRSEKGNANGYASLDSQGKVPISQLPSSIMEYKGTWNAATNTPTLANGTGDTGDVYICNVAGTVNFGAGPITFAVGDYVIYSGTIWQRSSGAVGTVTSVAASITGNSVTISGSPVTTSGTLAFAFAGTGAQYIKGDGTLATFPSTIAQAERLITEVYNSTGATLTKGTVVYINGGQGNLPTVTKAIATGDSTSAQTFGIVQADITNNNNGYVVIAGKLIDIDTQAYTEGTQLYLSSTTAGAYTSTKQYAPAHLVYVGIIVRSHPTQGIIEVKIQNGYELDELHNVAAQTPSNNDGLFYESSTSLWKNKSIATILGYTPQAQLNGTGFVKASGTTISYDNSTYVTTDTFQTISASKTFSVGFSIASAGGTNQISVFQNTNSLFSGSGGSNIFGFNSANNIYFGKGLDNGGVLQWNNSAVRYYTFPDATGTIALVGGSGVGTVTSVGLSVPTGFAVSGSPVTSSGTLALAFDTGYSLPTIVKQNNWDTAYNTRIVTASSPLSFISNTISISQASSSTDGYLSSTDWTTFNNKQNALTNPVTGTGTTNYLPKFTGTSTIGNSIVQDNGSVVTLGGAITVNVPTDNTTVAILHAGGGTANRGLKISTFVATNDNAGVTLDAQTSTGVLAFATAGTERMRLTSSGNLGLGVTPSAGLATANYRLFEIGLDGGGSIYSGSNQTLYGTNISWVGGTPNYVRTGSAPTLYNQSNGAHSWSTAPTGTAGNAISFTQAMTLTANGDLGVGTTSPNYTTSGRKVIAVDGSSSAIYALQNSGTSAGYLYGDGGNVILWAEGSRNLQLGGASTGSIFFTPNNSNAMIVTSAGNVGIGTTSPNRLTEIISSSGAVLGVSTTANGSGLLYGRIAMYSTAGSNSYIDYGGEIRSYSGAGIDNSDLRFYTANGSSSAERLRITNGGNVLIGTTTGDGYKLQIVGASQAAATFGQTYAGVAAYSQWVNSSGAFVMGLDGAAGTTERMRIKSNGIINLSNVPSSSAGLSSGDIYKTVAGVLMIV